MAFTPRLSIMKRMNSWTNSGLAQWNNSKGAISFVYFRNHRYLEILSIIFSMVELCNVLPSRSMFSSWELNFRTSENSKRRFGDSSLSLSEAGCLFSSQLAALFDASFSISTERSWQCEGVSSFSTWFDQLSTSMHWMEGTWPSLVASFGGDAQSLLQNLLGECSVVFSSSNLHWICPNRLSSRSLEMTYLFHFREKEWTPFTAFHWQ